MRKFFIIVVTIIAVIACAIWSPWSSWEFNWRSLFGVEPQPKLATLKINSLGGEFEIYVDNEILGIVGVDSEVVQFEEIEPGDREVKLIRPTESNNAEYYTYQSIINFTEDIDTVIAYELGPNKEFSKGHTISAYRNFLNDDATALTVNSYPEGATVTLNDQNIGTTPLTGYKLSRDSVVNLKLTKTGYEDLNISLLPEDEEARNALSGYDIVVDANLFLIPIDREIL